MKKEINKVLGITDASIYKGNGGYNFSSIELNTVKWTTECLNISTIVDSSMIEFITAVVFLCNGNELHISPSEKEDPHGIKNSVDLKVTTVEQQLKSKETDPEPPKEPIPCANTECSDYDPDNENNQGCHCQVHFPYKAMKCPEYKTQIPELKGLKDYTREELEMELKFRDEEVLVLIVPAKANVRINYDDDQGGFYSEDFLEDMIRKCALPNSRAYRMDLKCYRTKRGDL